MNQVNEFLKTHHSQIVYATGLLLALINLSIKLALNLHPLADWVTLAQKKPRLAALIRLSEALGINPISALQSLVDFFRKEASPGTLAAAKAIGVSASTPIIAPKGAVAGLKPAEAKVIIRPKIDIAQLEECIKFGAVVMSLQELQDIIDYVKMTEDKN